MDKKILEDKLEKVEEGIRSTELLFQQLLGQKGLLTDLITNYDKPREPNEEKK